MVNEGVEELSRQPRASTPSPGGPEARSRGDCDFRSPRTSWSSPFLPLLRGVIHDAVTSQPTISTHPWQQSKTKTHSFELSSQQQVTHQPPIDKFCADHAHSRRACLRE